jgi:membrane protease YdiL (CAAX protease family)
VNEPADQATNRSATPIAWWQASLLALLFALAPGPLLSALTLVIGRALGLGLERARLWVSQEPLVFALVSALSVMPALWLVRQPLPRPPLRQALALHPVSLRVVLVSIATGVALQLPLSEVANLIELIAPVSLEQKRAIAELLAIDSVLAGIKVALAVVVAAPLSEELLFRGALLRGMTRVHSRSIALLVSALLFGVSHAALVTSVLPATLAGLVLGWLTLRQRSIVPSIALHAAVNATPLLLPASLVTIPGFNTLQEAVYHVPPSWLIPSCVIALAGLWWLSRSKRNGHAASGDSDSA